MSIATIIGFIFAYPINSWMVKKGLKHGMMSMGMHHHKSPATISNSQQWKVIIGSFAFLLFIGYLTNLFIPIKFTL